MLWKREAAYRPQASGRGQSQTLKLQEVGRKWPLLPISRAVNDVTCMQKGKILGLSGSFPFSISISRMIYARGRSSKQIKGSAGILLPV